MINLSREGAFVAQQLGYFGKSIKKGVSEINETLGKWNSEDQTILHKMQDINAAMGNLVSSANYLVDLKIDELKHGSRDKWSGSYKSGKYDTKVDDVDKLIKKCRKSIEQNLSSSVAKVTELKSQLHFPWNGNIELQTAQNICNSYFGIATVE